MSRPEFERLGIRFEKSVAWAESPEAFKQPGEELKGKAAVDEENSCRCTIESELGLPPMPPHYKRLPLTDPPGVEGRFWVGIAIAALAVGAFYAVMALLIW